MLQIPLATCKSKGDARSSLMNPTVPLMYLPQDGFAGIDIAAMVQSTASLISALR